ERIPDRREIRKAARQRVEGRCCSRRGKLSLHLGGALEHAVPSLVVLNPTGRVAKSSLFPDGGRLWHKNGAMALSKARRARSPLNEEKLSELALSYVGRFATTRAKLQAYLRRKVRERGWEGGRPPDFEAIAQRFADRGFVDDAGYAL